VKRALLALFALCCCVDADEVRAEFCQGRPYFCDGGLVPYDAGTSNDAGTIEDAGTPDAGTPDAGAPDAGDGGP